MKYVSPYGVADPNAPYINGDPSQGREGSIPPAEAFEHPMREITNMISKAGINPLSSDLFQLLKAVRNGRVIYGVDTGSANVVSIALDPPLDVYQPGLTMRVLIAVSNTGAASLNINGVGSQPIVHSDGSQLGAGDILAGQVATMIYDGAHFQLIPGSKTTGFKIPFTIDTGTVNHVIANYTPAITALDGGLLLEVKIANTNTGVVDINVDGLGVKALVRPDGTNLTAGELDAGAVVIIIYDGTRFQLASIVSAAGFAIPFAVDTGTVNNVVANFAPPVSSLVPGFTCEVLVKNTTTLPAVTLNASGLGPIAIKRFDGEAFEKNELWIEGLYLFVYDGTLFRLVSGPQYATTAEAEAGVLWHKFISPATMWRSRSQYIGRAGSVHIYFPAGSLLTVTNMYELRGSFFRDPASGSNNAGFWVGPLDAGIWECFGYFGAAPYTPGYQGPGSFQAEFFVNGGSAGALTYCWNGDGSTIGVTVTQQFNLVAGDNVTLVAYQTTAYPYIYGSTQLNAYRVSSP